MTQGIDLELDHLTTQLTQHLERALIAARRAAQQRAQATRAPGRGTPAGGDQQTRDLASQHQLEALAARWAAADALRQRDPVSAAAWDARVLDAGVDLKKVHRESEIPAGGREPVAEHGLDRWFQDSTAERPGAEGERDRDAEFAASRTGSAGLDAGVLTTAVASDLVVEHLTEAYTDETLDAATAEPGPAPTVGDLLAAAHPNGVSPTPPGATVGDDADRAAEFIVARSMDTEQGQGVDVGVQR